MNSAAGSFTGFRKSSRAPRASDAISEKARIRRTVRRGVRAQQQQQQAASELEPGWDKLSSDDFDTWMDNGGPPTPLLVRPLLLVTMHVCAERPIPMQQSLSKAGMVQDTVNFPVHLKNFNLSQLRQLCKELRSDIVHTVSKTGGEQTPDSSYIAPWKTRECQHMWSSILDFPSHERRLNKTQVIWAHPWAWWN